jgi:hypothetical protein
MHAVGRFIQQRWFALGIIAYTVAMAGLLGSGLLFYAH